MLDTSSIRFDKGKGSCAHAQVMWTVRSIFGQRFFLPLFCLSAVELMVVWVSGAVGLFMSWAKVEEFNSEVFRYFPQMLSFVAVILMSMYACGLYTWANVSDRSDAFIRVTVALALSFVVLACIFYIFPYVLFFRSAMAFSLPMALVGLLVSRVIFLRIVDIGWIRRRIIVLGAGAQALRVAALEQKYKGCRFTCVAFVHSANEERLIDESRVVRPPASLVGMVDELKADEIVVAVSERRGSLPLKLLIDCRFAGIPVIPYQEFCEHEVSRVDLEALRPDWFLSMDGFPRGSWQGWLKRTLDVMGSTLLLIMSWPLFLATAVAIKIEGPGPVFYRQERLGLRGRSFLLTKFRSMYRDAERDGIPRWASSGDTRVTLIGKLIRSTRIDEIPQIFNVLKGEMSLVGPRPERPYFVQQLAQQISYYSARHYVKPGITGWAQLNYSYAASVEDAKKKLEYDLFYIKYFSIIRDILIIIQTIRVIIWRTGVR